MYKTYNNYAVSLFLLATALSPAALAQPTATYCATDVQKLKIAEAVNAREGAPTVIYARNLEMPEQTVVSGLPDTVRAYGVDMTPERVKEIWASVDEWGGETFTHVIFTMGGDHVADFPSLVPVMQPLDDSGFIDIYADEGRGVHGHVLLERVNAVYAAELHGRDAVTRMVSLYNKDGGLIVGMYASIAGKEFDQRAVDGFENTFAKLQEYPAACE